MTAAYALAKILCNEKGQAVDYIFINITPSFAATVGIDRNAALGKKASEAEYPWQDCAGELPGAFVEAALAGRSREMRVFDAQTKRWHRLSISSPAKEYFVILACDITEETAQFAVLNEELRRTILGPTIEKPRHSYGAEHQKLCTDDAELPLGSIHQKETRLQSILNVLEYKTNSLQAFLDHALNEVIRLTRSKFGFLYFYEETSEEFILNSWSKDVFAECRIIEPHARYALEKTGFWGEAVRQGRPIIENEFQKPNPYKRGYPEGHVQVKKFLAVPVFYEEQIVAVVGVANKSHDYDQNDILDISLVMNSIWKSVEIRRMHELIYDSEERYRLLFMNMAEGNALYRLMASPDGQPVDFEILKVNPAYESIFGVKREQVEGKISSEVPNLPEKAFLDMYVRVALTAKTETLETYVSGIDKYLQISVHYVKKDFFAAIFEDVTEEKKRLDEIKYLSMYDQLTGLYNRTFFEEMMAKVNNDVKALPLSVIVGDVNGLKLINDAFGHHAGDDLLIEVARILKMSCNADDIIARLGGDEFAILLPKTSHIEASIKIKCIHDRISAAANQPIIKNIALGSATKEKETEDFSLVFKKAEDRMYRRKLLESKSLRSGYMHSLKETLFQKSYETHDHANRLKCGSKRIALELGLMPSENDDLELLCLLHDVGKIAISDSILLKPGKLTDEEWTEMKRHVEIGYRIAQNIPELSSIAEYILCHHERWDGKGYPQGLKGEEIPLLARIISVVDAYDAMTNDRAYRQAMIPEAALAEIRKHAGTQFDPRVARIFCKVCSEDTIGG